MIGAAAAVAFGAGTLVGASERQPEMEQMDPDAMMAAMAEANALTEHHEAFAWWVGTWDGHLTAQVPGGEPFESKGVMTHELLMDGRFLKGTWEGEVWGEPFTGVALTGYSSLEGEYQGVWFDSTANQISYTTGNEVDESTMVMNGKETDPMTGQTLEYKDVLKRIDDDTSTFTRMYITPMGEMEGFTIKYTRRK